MRNLGTAVAGVLALCLVGCSGGGDDGPAAATEIRAFAVTGTNSAVSGSGQQVVINHTQNGGQFRVQWDAKSSTRPYRADVYVSVDATLSNGDKQFLGRNCDQPTGDCAAPAASFTCSYTSDVRFVCSSLAGDSTQMGTYFSGAGGLPGDYHMILRVCDGLFNDCTTRSVPVRIE